MSQVVRYFHIRRGTKGGACVKVTGDTGIVGQVDVQVAQCSKKDNYVKAIGRAEAAKAPTKVVPLRYLPQELGRIQAKSGSRLATDYTFAVRYFLPKE